MERMALSDDIKRRLITLHGTLDLYLSIANDRTHSSGCIVHSHTDKTATVTA